MQQLELHEIKPQSIKIGPIEGSKQSEDGIVPVNELFSKSKDVNFVKNSISVGIEEVNELPKKDKNINCVRSPISLGIVEVN
jgi:hypothetical protein